MRGGWSPRCRGWCGPVESAGFGAWWTIRRVMRRANAKRDGTRAETRIGLSAKRTSPFQSAGGSVQSTTGSRGVRSVDARRLATHSIRVFPLHFPSRASPCAIRSRVSYTIRTVRGGASSMGIWE